MGFRAEGLNLGFRVFWGLGWRVEGLGFRVEGLNLGFRVFWGLGWRA